MPFANRSELESSVRDTREMIRIVKLIFRFDFDTNFHFIDVPGTMLQFLTAKESYWTEVGDTKDFRRLSARTKDPLNLSLRNINLEPHTINGVLEQAEGLQWGSAPVTNYLAECSSVVASVMEECSITKFSRAGLRFLLFLHDEVDTITFRAAQRGIFSTTMLEAYEENFGTMSDFAITINGLLPSNLTYKLIMGPASTSDLARLTTKLADSTEETTKESHRLTMDVDLYEENLDFAGLTLQKWARTKWAAAAGLMEFLEKQASGAS